jgi:hypothetical protein
MTARKKISKNFLAEAGSVRAFSGDMLPYMAANLLQLAREAKEETPEFRSHIIQFFQHTVLAMAPHGLVGYQVIVPPDGAPLLIPDELALVWYATRTAYQNAAGTASRFVYSPAHWLVFDKKSSWSTYPEIFVEQMESRKPVHLFGTPVNPQNCTTRILLTTTNPKLSQGQARKQLALCLVEIQRFQRPGLESLICWTDRNYVVVWENWTKGSKMDTGNLDLIASNSGEVIMRTDAQEFKLALNATDPEPTGLVVDAEGACFNFTFSQ